MKPITVEVTRGDLVESTHQVHVAVATPGGLEVWGDGDRLTFPRSAAKLMQALPLVESGAADRLGLADVQLALACASHGGETRHATEVGRWLDGLNLSESHLECGLHWPMHEPSGRQMSAQGETLCQLHNNCSGKHAGFLSLAQDQGWDTQGYIQREHPVQAAIEQCIEEVLETPVGPAGIDGCGIPTYANRLSDLALGLYRLAQATGVRGKAVQRLADAHRREPYLIGGTDRCCTAINGELRDGMVKYGAEAVYFGLFPKAKIGIALKVEDGTVRACEVAMVAMLKQFGLLPEDALPQWHCQPLKNRAGDLVGQVRVSG